ncbi:glycosyltransferase family 87 protein [Daejeonella sp.]|uniref:glycosyltransferase family 87 protein n=1 Tax=Daejeonella sp. TaxID=2805397 RepID=UPI00272F245F|nr:glycosyltransferase family 87 protein [Daejeonella sp.]MDP2415492.1 glycosyltransferase family 87 protein [Daejeonella sp.]
MLKVVNTFFTETIFKKKIYIFSLWYLISALALIKILKSGNYNNFLIFKFTFFSLLDQKNLFLPQPENFQHYNLYGPIFSVLIAPFAILPNWLGHTLWTFFNSFILLFAIRKLPLPSGTTLAILLIAAHENLTSILSSQFNPSMTAIVLLTYTFIDQKKDFWAALMIVLGTFIKLYGIVGLAFFLFSKNKLMLVSGLIFWSALAFSIPMLFSSPAYIVQTYKDWFEAITEKNRMNSTLITDQDICLMGMVRRISGNHLIPNWPFLGAGIILFGLPYLRISQYKESTFRLLILSSTLIFTVIFSTSSESPTYIIAFTGVAIWFVNQKRPLKPWQIVLFVFAILLTSFSPSDLFPKFIRDEFIKPYSLKALPCVLIWLAISYQLLTRDFKNYGLVK